MQTLLSHCLSYGLNERTNFMNKDSPIGKHFPKLPRYGERFIDTRTRSKITNHDLLSVIDIFFNFPKQFSLKHGSNKSQKLQRTKIIRTSSSIFTILIISKKNWLDLITCIVLAKVCKK